MYTHATLPETFQFSITNDDGVLGDNRFLAWYVGSNEYVVLRKEPLVKAGYNTAVYKESEVLGFINKERWVIID